MVSSCAIASMCQFAEKPSPGLTVANAFWMKAVKRQPVWSILSAIFLVSGPGLIWKASRDLDAKPGPLVVALSGAIMVALASAHPGTRNIIGRLSIAASSIYCFAATFTLWTGRKEHLFARWPLMILTGVHGVVLSIGTYSTFNGSIAGGEIPPLLSLFGLIHFESIVFTIGTAVFVLTLVKERNEAAIRHSAIVDPLTGSGSMSPLRKIAASSRGVR
jgi:hypothetical protein